MCTMQLFYWTDGDQILETRPIGNTPGPPRYSWAIDRMMPLLPPDVDFSASQPD